MLHILYCFEDGLSLAHSSISSFCNFSWYGCMSAFSRVFHLFSVVSWVTCDGSEKCYSNSCIKNRQRFYQALDSVYSACNFTKLKNYTQRKTCSVLRTHPTINLSRNILWREDFIKHTIDERELNFSSRDKHEQCCRKGRERAGKAAELLDTGCVFVKSRKTLQKSSEESCDKGLSAKKENCGELFLYLSSNTSSFAPKSYQYI